MRNYLILFVLSLSHWASAQLFKVNDVWLEGRYKIGFLVAHHELMAHLPQKHAKDYSLSLVFQTRGNKGWQKAYKYPMVGLTAYYSSVGNDKVLGYYTGAFVFSELPFIKTNKISFSAKIGVGISYTNKVYDLEDNKLNVAISTPINARVSMGLMMRKTVFSKHQLSLGIDITHYSNSSIKMPNLGINLPYISLGYTTKIKASNFKEENKILETPKYWQFGILGIASVKEYAVIGSKKYPVFGLNFMGRRFFNQKTAMEISLDFFSKQAILDYYPEISKTQWDIFQIGLFAGYILPFDRLHLITGMGFYLRDKFQPEDPFYHRIGIRYITNKGLNFNLVLKSHWGRADYTEFGIGYTIRRNRIKKIKDF